MSYILEALKRAERERRAGKTSLLDEVASAAPPAPTPDWRRWLPAAAIAALIAAAITYLLLAHRGQPQPVALAKEQAQVANVPPSDVAAAIPAPQPTAPAAPASSALPSSTVAPVASTPRTTPPPAATVEDDGHIASLDDLEPPAPPPAAATRPNHASTPNPAASGSTPQRQQSRGDEATDDATQAQTTSRPQPQSMVTPGSDAASPASTSTQEAQPPALREMPDAYRAGFPSITIDVHAYSDDPAQRFVLIDGKRYHENEALPQGPRIVAIVAEGIVFDWKGERVLYAINH